MEDEIDFSQLNYLHPKIRPYVKVLLTHEFGLLRELPIIENIQCGGLIQKNGKFWGDRFHLKISYCKKILNWQVLMNGNDVRKPPDFIMDDNFLGEVTSAVIETKVPSLANWCPTDINCLLNVVLEFLDLYKNYQKILLKENPLLQRYLFEYETLLSMLDKTEEDVELLVQFRNPIVVFVVHLNIDFSKLPTALPDTKDFVVLVVEFKDNAKSVIQLIPRIELKDVFSGPSELPDLRPDMSLMDYIPMVEALLQHKVEKAIYHNYHRKMLYSHLIQFFEPAVINGDSLNFKNVSFLLEVEDFYCILNVRIPLDYPNTRPNLQFLSFSRNERGLQDYTYEKKLSPEDVARNIYTYVKDTGLMAFKRKHETETKGSKKKLNAKRNSPAS